jgi:Bacterial TniB protein
MTADFSARPELMMGPNPFIEALPPYLTPQDLARKFSNYPLDNKPWRELPPVLREPLLEFAPEHIAPTSAILPVVITIQTLIRRSMCQRNPLHQDERRRCNMIGVAENISTIRATPRLNAAGATLEGMTGMGKTMVSSRTLQLVAPHQVIDHGSSSTYGWIRLRQVTWLYVDHPSNGSRGALLKRVLAALDEVLGTDFSDQYARVVNIDTLLTQVCKQLSLYRVALLIIDEKQQRNFQDSPWSLEFVLFYLSLMNLGISILLIGNPMAFEHLRAFSQVVRRFSSGGMHRLNPAANEHEAWWRDDLVPRLQRFNLVEHCSIDPSERSRFEYQHTAGIPGLLQLLHLEAQRSALRRATGGQAALAMTDLEAALQSPSFMDVAPVARQVLNRGEVNTLMTDIPNSDESGEIGGMDAFKVPDGMTVDAIKRLTKKYQSSQTRELKKFQTMLGSVSKLTEEEQQILGIKSDLLTEVRNAQARVKDKKPAVKSKPDGQPNDPKR